jgi:phosphohistidine swiveling domain-containing protein
LGATIQSPGAKVTPFDEWTRANIGEVVPERMTPFSFAVWEEPMNKLLALSFRHFELDTWRFQFIRSQDGWLTYNIGAVNHLAEQIGLPPMDAAVGATAGPLAPRGRIRWLRLLRHAPGLARSSWGQVRLARRFETARVQAGEIAARYRARVQDADDPARLIEHAYAAYRELESFLALYADATAAAFSTYVLLERASARLAPGVNPPSLLRSEGVAVTGIAQAVLAAAARAEDERALAEFLEEFGHRGWQELELANRSWRSDPSVVIAVAARYREAAAAGGPRQAPAAAGGPRQAQAAPDPRAQLDGWRGLVLRALAARAGEFAAIRENVKHEFYRPIDAIRALVQQAAALLEAGGRLEAAADMFFLEPGELRALTDGDASGELRALAARRRAFWAGREPGADGPGPAAQRPAHLQGVGASPGEAVGTARVLRGPDQAGRLGAGDILVVEALDIGWTPVFGLVGGIVTSVGGVLSHPCTVARELRVPVVAGVASSQTLIRDGDRVRIDGAAGDVELLLAAGG